jgi:hypothetical protein
MEYLPNPRPLAVERAKKGSSRSMWETLLQLRELLPYLTQLVPLLDRGLKAPPEVAQLSHEVAIIQSGSRELEVQARNQALQLERIEQQLARLRKLQETTFENSRKLLTDARTLRRWVIAMVVMMGLLIGAAAGIVTFLLSRT